MLMLAIAALVVSIVAGSLGFRKTSEGAAMIPKVIFGVFLLLFLIFTALMLLGINLLT